jgi:hypothetical protein
MFHLMDGFGSDMLLSIGYRMDNYRFLILPVHAYKVAILLDLQRISGVEVLETMFTHLSRIVLCWRDFAHPRKSLSINRFYAGA